MTRKKSRTGRRGPYVVRCPQCGGKVVSDAPGNAIAGEVCASCQPLRAAHKLHRDAMICADRADLARKDNDATKARNWFFAAYVFELEAAELAKLQPSRAVLFRSAASLAKCGGFEPEAAAVVARALDEPNVPAEIAAELRDVLLPLDLVHFEKRPEDPTVDPHELMRKPWLLA